MRIKLTVTEGAHKGKEFTFTGHDTLLVGRSSRAHFRLSDEDRYFSRNHFLIEANPPRCRLLDMKSRNGTYVNGERVETCELKGGDQIKAGRTVIQVTFESVPSSPSIDVLPPGAKIADHSEPPPIRRPKPAAMPTRCPLCGNQRANSGEGSSPLCGECEQKARSREQIVEGYRIVQQLGGGAMGIVSLAVRLADGLPVALKTVTPAVAVRPHQVERFLREAKILSQLRHPNIVAFHDMGEADGLFWFAMDYVRGLDAFRLLRKEGPLSVGRATGLICQLLEALAHAHDSKFVHRDIKPSNMLIEQTAEGERTKLADFGLARIYQTSELSGLTLSGEIGGTVGFMAPEQITEFRETEPAADLFSVAATLYNLLTGSFIFNLEGDLRQRLLAVLQDDPVPILNRRADLPRKLAKIIHRGLEREPVKRWPDAASFRDVLLPYVK
jgi:serine/threonine-protein kinase